MLKRLPRGNQVRYLITNQRRWSGAAVLLLAALVGCALTTPTGAPATSAAAPSSLADISLEPARQSASPPVIETAVAVPSIAPPQGAPSDAPAAEITYTLGADDAGAFAAAYRSAFDTGDMDDAAIDQRVRTAATGGAGKPP